MPDEEPDWAFIQQLQDEAWLLEQKMSDAISNCNHRDFIEAYSEALLWSEEAKSWKGVDKDLIYNYRYKLLPELKARFGINCKCEAK